MTPKGRIIAIVATACVTLAAVLALRPSTQHTAIPMIDGCATTITTDFDAFPEDITAVALTWNKPIPDDFIQIGGIDWFGWAKICRDNADDPGIFRGEYRDAKQRCDGPWRIVDPQDRALPDNILERYQLSHFSNNRLTLSNFTGAPDDFIYLEPVIRANIETNN